MSNTPTSLEVTPHLVKYSVPFAAAANAGLIRAAEALRMEPTEVIQRATLRFLIDDDFIDKPAADRIKLFWALVDQTVTAAQDICRRGEFDASITLNAIKMCMKNAARLDGFKCTWVEGYRTYIGDDIFKNGKPAKGPINREIGFRIRAGIGGETEKGPDGKAKTVKVLGEIIQSFTPMADYDRAAFGPKTN